MEQRFPFRAVVPGLFIGILVNLSNTYYGLQTGVGSQMAMVSGLLGYALFIVFSRHSVCPLTAAENVLIISVATATGCMPITAGFTGVIPAIEYVMGPEDNGPHPINWQNLILWSLGICFFGLIFAVFLHEHFIMGEKLPWPGPKATSHLINTLHRRDGNSSDFAYRRQSLDLHGDSAHGSDESLLEHDTTGGEDSDEWNAKIKVLTQSSILSAVAGVVFYFLPILRRVPLFGSHAAYTWLWTADLSPGFIGQGIITGPGISLNMLLGAIFGWGILSPFAKYKGWAPGPVDDWETGSRGWTIWVSLAALMADASVKLSWFFLRLIWNHSDATRVLKHFPSCWTRSAMRPKVQCDENEPLIPQQQNASDGSEYSQDCISDGTHSFEAPATPKFLWLSFFLSIIACTMAMHFVFGDMMPWYYTIVAVMLALPMAVVGIRSLAETDYNPESALFSQLIFATLTTPSNPNAIILNIVSAGISQAGSNQSGDISYDFKVGHLVGADPRAQLYGQIIGSIFGAFISCGIYKLYSSQYPIPGKFFQVPAAFLDVSIARLLMGRGLPAGVKPWAIGTGVAFMVITVVKIKFAKSWWATFVPGGVAFAIGAYNKPSFTIARVVGGVAYWAYCRRHDGQEKNIMIFASGLVLGESIASILNLGLTALQIPKFG